MTPARREAVQDRGTDSPRRSKIPTPRLTPQGPHRGRTVADDSQQVSGKVRELDRTLTWLRDEEAHRPEPTQTRPTTRVSNCVATATAVHVRRRTHADTQAQLSASIQHGRGCLS